MIFRYPGGKNRKSIQNWILSLAPKSFKEYREPFVGGGGIFFAIDKQSWINDCNPDLMSVYQALKERPEEFIAACREIEPAKDGEPLSAAKPNSTHALAKGKAIYNARLLEVFNQFTEDDGMDPALRYFFVNRTVWGGRVIYDKKSRMYFSHPQGWDITTTQKLENAAQHLASTRITCGDYRPLLEEPGDDVWIYCDPPYVVNTKLSDAYKLYKFGFNESDHATFAEVVKRSPHKVAVSYDDCEMIRDLFAGSNFYTREWAYVGTSSSENQPNREKKRGKELIITNYKSA